MTYNKGAWRALPATEGVRWEGEKPAHPRCASAASFASACCETAEERTVIVGELLGTPGARTFSPLLRVAAFAGLVSARDHLVMGGIDILLVLFRHVVNR